MDGSSFIESNSIISIQNVVWKRSGKPILNGVSWDVSAGQHWAIVGLNGCGKTSLLNMITGYEWPSSGQIHVLGHQLGRVDLHELRKHIGWVSLSLHDRYQTHSKLTALEVALSGKFASIGIYQTITAVDQEKGLHLLDKFHALHLADKPFFTLSQGEKQKVMLARAWMADPKLIILDEPCNGLDIRAREELLITIEQLASSPKGPTLLYVTHRIEEIMPSFSHALLMQSGQVLAAGEKENVFTPSLLEETFQLPINLHWENNRIYISGRKS